MPYLTTRQRERRTNLRPTFAWIEVSEELTNKIRKHVHKNTNIQTIMSLLTSFGLGTSSNILSSMKETSIDSTSWKAQIANWNTETEDFICLKNLLLASFVQDILNASDELINEFARNSRYIAPVRATAERYYRIQNLDVDEVDFQGRNLAMFLRNLSEMERQKFSEWTEENFNISLQARPSSGHVSLKVRETGSTSEFNLADMGFGFSQVLPILTQLWILNHNNLASSKTNFKVSNLPSIVSFAIEQPELHLHPRLQAKLADAFVDIVRISKNNELDLKLIVETHSEAIVNRLGHLIANSRLNPEDVNVVLFQKENPNTPTEIHFGKFNKDGFLTNWPFGFFEPDSF